MSSNYILADSLIRIKNAQAAKLKCVELCFSKLLLDCLFLLKKEGYIGDFYAKEIRPGINKIFVTLKYYASAGVIARIKLFSRPGRRVYIGVDDLNKRLDRLRLLVISTSKGILSSTKAVNMRCGGELLFEVY